MPGLMGLCDFLVLNATAALSGTDCTCLGCCGGQEHGCCGHVTLACLAGCSHDRPAVGRRWCLVSPCINFGSRLAWHKPDGDGFQAWGRGVGDACPAVSTCGHLAASPTGAVCLQASVYLVRSGKGNARRVKAHSVHAPARRLARTTISLGPDEGIAFGLRAVRLVYQCAWIFKLCLLRVKTL